MLKRLLFIAFVLGCALAHGQQNVHEYVVQLQKNPDSAALPYRQTIAISAIDSVGFVGISDYTTDTSAPLQLWLRVFGENTWHAWQPLNPPHEASAKGRLSFEAPPLFFSVSKIEIKASRAVHPNLVLRVFVAPPEKKSTNERAGVSVANSIDSCNCAIPTFCDRNCWCPNNNCPPPAAYTPTVPTHLIMHHSAGFTNYSNYAWVVAYYWDLHVNTNNWDDIGYNWLIDPNGVIYEGRGSGNQGAHFSCMNSGTLGICIIGNYQTTTPSTSAWSAAVQLLAYESCLNHIVPTDSSIHASSQLMLRHISGHRDGNSATVGCPSGTDCPGNSFYPQLDSLGNAVGAQNCLMQLQENNLSRAAILPNPNSGSFTLRLQHWSNYQWQVMSFTGQTLRQGQFEGTETTIQTNLPTGMYLLKIAKENEQVCLKWRVY